jgi:DNA polymerase III gamma/tau subunit
MIDPITIGAAFAVAKGAVAGIKQALELGHEIKDCYQDLQSFFHSQAEIEKAAKTVEAVKTQPKSEDPKQAAEQESVLSQAFTIVMARKQAKEAEIQLRDLFAMKGELGLYQELCQERDRLSGEQDESNREAIRKARLAKDRAARKKEEFEQALMTAGIFVFLGIGGIIIFVAIYFKG